MTRARPYDTHEAGIVRRNILLFCLTALVVVTLTITTITWVHQTSELDAQGSDVQRTQAQAQSAQVVDARRRIMDVQESLGIDSHRVSTDTATIGSLVATMFTWSSGPTYDRARRSLMKNYSLSSSDPFMRSFLPPAKFSTDKTGKRYYYIDAMGLNSSVSAEDGSVQVSTSVSVAGNYHYVVRADIELTADDVSQHQATADSVTGHRMALLLVTIDPQGKLTELSGSMSSGSIRHSD